MGILKPETIQDIIPGFRYSPETLKAIDELRHKSVHQANWFEPFDTFENVEKMTDYLRNVAETIFLLSLRRYKIIEEA